MTIKNDDMNKLKILCGFLFSMLLFGCSQSPREHMYAEVAEATMFDEAEDIVPLSASEDDVILGNGSYSLSSNNFTSYAAGVTNNSSYSRSKNDFISSSAAIATEKDSTRKFIRTADLKFRVKSVIDATYNIENIALNKGGFVTFTNLTSQVDYITTTAISADSILETTYYTVRNLIVLRVPNTKLDATLKEISQNIDFLDHRIIKADDIALQLLTNDLAQKRAAKTEQRLANAIDNRGRRLNETVDAEQLLTRQQERADNAKIANLKLADQIEFSTINLLIYQRQTIKREVLQNDKSIKGYEPSLGRKLVDAAKSGWNILTAILVFLVNIWALLLIAVLIFVLFKYKHKFKQFFKNIFK